MKRVLLVASLVMTLGGGWVIAETSPPPPRSPPAAGHPPEHGAPAMPDGDHSMKGMGAMGAMGGMGMMGGGMGPMMMMGGPGTKVAVKNVDKGVTITLTSNDPAMVIRLQKMAEAMRLMHEAMNP